MKYLVAALAVFCSVKCAGAQIAGVNTGAAEIPAVRMSPAVPQVQLDLAIASAVISLRKSGKVRLADGFQCLMAEGTYEQKFAFVYGDKRVPYKLPETCMPARRAPEFAGSQKGVVDTVVNCVAKWACKTYTTAVTYYNCWTDSSGEQKCDEVVKNVVETSCDWEC